MSFGHPSRVLRVDPQQPDQRSIDEAAAVLRAGGLVAFPTETVYGLGANALDAVAVARIFAAKGRPAGNPLIVHAASIAEAKTLASNWPMCAQLLAERFWPGPLTLVLPCAAHVPKVVTAGGPTVAMRIPDHATALALLRAARLPIAAPSANRSGAISPTLAEHVVQGLGEKVDLLLDAGPTAAGIESTVLDISSPVPRLLRPGPIPLGKFESLIGRVEFGSEDGDEPSVLRSPGMLRRHYAPRTPLILAESRAHAISLASAPGTAVLAFGSCQDFAGSILREMPIDRRAFEAALYATLHELDALGLNRIVAEMPPESDEWLAARDRLTRAAARE